MKENIPRETMPRNPELTLSLFVEEFLQFSIGSDRDKGTKLRKVNIIGKPGKVGRKIDRGKGEVCSGKRKDLMDIDVETSDMQNDLQKKIKAGFMGIGVGDEVISNEVVVSDDDQHRKRQ